MTDQDYIHLEALLSKMRAELGDRYTISPDYLFDGYQIATFDSESGLLKKSEIAATLKGAVEKILKK